MPMTIESEYFRNAGFDRGHFFGGGFCAWAVSRGYKASIDPNAFQVVNGRLLLQYSLSVRKDFSEDTEGNLKKADANWPAIVEKKGK